MFLASPLKDTTTEVTSMTRHPFTEHNYHLLAHKGFKGLERIERDRRMDAMLVRLGECLIILFAVLGVIACL